MGCICFGIIYVSLNFEPENRSGIDYESNHGGF
jgi:hypothetical protein